MSPLPDVGEVTWQTAGDDVDRVDAQFVALAHVARRKPLSGSDHAPDPPFVERHCGSVGGRARLDLDEGKRAAAAGDKIDLSARDARAAGENAPAVEAEPPCGDGFRAPAALLGCVAVQRARSKARA